MQQQQVTQQVPEAQPAQQAQHSEPMRTAPDAERRGHARGAVGRLRVGLLLGGDRVPAWVARMLDQVRDSGVADIVLAVVDASPPSPPAPSLRTLARREPRRAADRVARRVLERLIERLGQAPATLPDAFAPVSWREDWPDLPTLEVRPNRTQWSDRFGDAEIAAIRAHDLDVLVRIGFRILRGDILRVARYGVWSFHHGDNDVNRGGPPAYWEAMQSWPITGCTLQILSEDLDNGLVLDKTWSGTQDESVEDNRRGLYWTALSMLGRNLSALQRLGPDVFFARARRAQAHPQWYSRRLFRAPETRELAALLVRRMRRRLRRIVAARTGFDQWQMLVHVSDGLSLSAWRYRRLVPPPDRFWADPFLLQHGGRTWLYFEELMFSTGRGHIAVGELDADGRMASWQPALVLDHHLSYPFVFEHEGELYMIPESREARSVTLYRCVEMPARWEKVHDLMAGVEAVDATLHPHDGRWWMFVNLVANPGASSCNELHLFHADSPLSATWTPHPKNPVVSDARRARPAGALFEHAGRLYRPSQDCAERYGRALNVNWVRTLTVDDYEEVGVSRAEPDWAPDVRAVHTFNRQGRFHVIDAEIRRPGRAGR